MAATLIRGPPGQPDITYAPDFAKYQQRSAAILSRDDLPQALPGDLPRRLTGDLVWDGDSIRAAYKWTFVLTTDQVKEIEGALRHFQCEWSDKHARTPV
jgi:hypothetical protein